MENYLTIVFGKEQVQKISNDKNLTPEEMALYKKTYTFDTPTEKEAFVRGMHEALGWLEFVEVDNSLLLNNDRA